MKCEHWKRFYFNFLPAMSESRYFIAKTSFKLKFSHAFHMNTNQRMSGKIASLLESTRFFIEFSYLEIKVKHKNLKDLKKLSKQRYFIGNILLKYGNFHLGLLKYGKKTKWNLLNLSKSNNITILFLIKTFHKFLIEWECKSAKSYEYEYLIILFYFNY